MCPEGYYTVTGEEKECIMCPAGFTTVTAGSSSAALCSGASPADMEHRKTRALPKNCPNLHVTNFDVSVLRESASQG